MFVPVWDRPSVAEPTEAQDRPVMETKSAAIHRKMPMPARQLPITGFAHKTRNGHRPLVPQPTLPEVSGRGGQSVARRAGIRTVAGSLLSSRIHVAGRRRRHRLSEKSD